jgi:hypothetical protein
VKAGWIESAQVTSASDWRPAYHFSPAMQLERLGAGWPRLGSLAECLDGWRVSTNPASLSYDGRVETSPIYRMRHIGDARLLTEAEHWQAPQVTGAPFCVQPNDILVRKVGKVGAALVGDRHRRHPADANLAIVRGLGTAQALWVAYCLSRPLYRAYLERSEGITTLVRVGLKQLASVPVAPLPEGFMEFAARYLAEQSDFDQAQEQLNRLRREVSTWINEHFDDYQSQLSLDLGARRWRRFDSEDLTDILLFSVMEQRYLARRLHQDGLAVPVSELASINPRHPSVERESDCKVLRISDLDDHLGIASRLTGREDMAWRVQRRPTQVFDVLISTFASEAKVALVTEPFSECVLPTEQLTTLCFHRHQGAYALLMESSLVQAQWQRLTTGSVQRFVSPSSVRQLVLPTLETKRAESWHERLTEILAVRRKAQQRLTMARIRMSDYYRTVHPAIDEDAPVSEEGDAP